MYGPTGNGGWTWTCVKCNVPAHVWHNVDGAKWHAEYHELQFHDKDPWTLVNHTTFEELAEAAFDKLLEQKELVNT